MKYWSVPVATFILILSNCSNGTFNDRSSSSSSEKEESASRDGEDDGKSLQPADVSGSYLICEFTNQVDPSSDVVTVGCKAYKKNGEKLDLQGSEVKWTAANTDYQQVEDATVKKSGFDSLWKVPAAKYEPIKAELSFPGTTLKAVVTKKADRCYSRRHQGELLKLCYDEELESLYIVTKLPDTYPYTELKISIYQISAENRCTNPVPSVITAATKLKGNIYLTYTLQNQYRGNDFCALIQSTTDTDFKLVLRGEGVVY